MDVAQAKGSDRGDPAIPQRRAAVIPDTLAAVIFDVDGTLADTEPDGHRVAFNRAFDEFGLDWYWSRADYGRLLEITGGKERIRHYAAAHAPAVAAGAAFDLWVARLHHLKSEIYSSLILAGGIPLRPGVARIIRELRGAGVRLAIATTTTPSSLAALIMAHFGHDMAALFDVVGAGDVVPRKKPAPDIYHWVLERLELPAASCLVIEDSPAGLAAARAAGIPSIVTESAYTAGAGFDGALSVVSDLGEPGAPAKHLAGLPLDGDCVGLAQLKRWHAAARAGLTRGQAGGLPIA